MFFLSRTKKEKQVSINTYRDYCDAARTEDINIAIRKLIAGCSLSFAMVCCKFFLDLIKALNTAYACPSEKVFRFCLIPEL